MAITVLMLIAAAIGADRWRKAQIVASENELESALQQLRGEFAEVEDWPAWYQKRVSGECGYPEFTLWARTCSGKLFLDSSVELRLFAHFRDGDPLPDLAVLKAFVDASEQCEREAFGLLRFPTLTGVPEFTDEEVAVTVLDKSVALNWLRCRALALMAVGERGRAWKTIGLCLELVHRIRHSVGTIDYWFNAASYASTIDAFLCLCAVDCPPRELDHLFPLPEPLDDPYELFMLQRAFFSQIAANPQWSTALRSKRSERGLFAWLLKGEKFGRYESSVEENDELTEYLRALHVLQDPSQPLPMVSSHETLRNLSRPAGNRALIAHANLLANFVWAARRAEQAGHRPQDHVPDASAFDVLSVSLRNNGISWELRPSAAQFSKWSGPFVDFNARAWGSQHIRLIPLK
ncbi:MAG: hypothetical protein IPK87_04970 [Planctomycetes bacterium]|nr:hypothetical protein [Planctomycetota bacterium]